MTPTPSGMRDQERLRAALLPYLCTSWSVVQFMQLAGYLGTKYICTDSFDTEVESHKAQSIPLQESVEGHDRFDWILLPPLANCLRSIGLDGVLPQYLLCSGPRVTPSPVCPACQFRPTSDKCSNLTQKRIRLSGSVLQPATCSHHFGRTTWHALHQILGAGSYGGRVLRGPRITGWRVIAFASLRQSHQPYRAKSPLLDLRVYITRRIGVERNREPEIYLVACPP
jgi:hypothetical protein